MGLFESVQEVAGKGVSVAREAVSGALLESQGFVRAFVRMCGDGWDQGWHERNGGNASMRLLPEEVAWARLYFSENPGEWEPLGVRDAQLAGAFFLVTATGSYMRSVPLDPASTLGIVEIDGEGAFYRVVWGFRDGGRPTSEFAGHYLIHCARYRASQGESRVFYHAHPVAVIALSKVLPPDARAFTRVLWQAMTECVMVFPEGVGLVGFEVPGSLELARASAREMERAQAVVWSHHGLLCAGSSCDDAFGRMHVIVKAAEIYQAGRLMSGGAERTPFSVSDDEVRAIARKYGLAVNEAYLD